MEILADLQSDFDFFESGGNVFATWFSGV